MSSEHRANRLARETSPYLLQHAHNPVDWYPWGPEALARSEGEQKPIFLSVGYSACHWCHVMERESFENEKIAELLNQFFVCIKVDREERPDIDALYMRAVQTMTGQGGWPMSVFLSPDLEPFYGGTYFPPLRGFHGQPGFYELVGGIAQAWGKDRTKLVDRGRDLVQRIAKDASADKRESLDPSILDRSLESLSERYDSMYGGFGPAPKFPHPMDVRMCLRHHLRTGQDEPLAMASFTLERMAAGGMYDQIGGGFHRYSVDERWLVPHFEKMLYDNALLIPAYLEGARATGDTSFAAVAEHVGEWVLREMLVQGGGFASALDADSEGEEGIFYTWTPDEITAVVGRENAALVQHWYDIDDAGHMEDQRSIPNVSEARERVASRLKGRDIDELRTAVHALHPELLAARETRIRPMRDDKVLSGWNALMISAFAQLHQHTGDERWLNAASDAAQFVMNHLRRDDGRLFATFRWNEDGESGRAQHMGSLDDHAYFVQALLDLHESDFDPEWIQLALEFEGLIDTHFHDPEHGGYWDTPNDHEKLPARLRRIEDGAIPSGNAVHALNLMRLAQLTGEARLAKRAEGVIRAAGQSVNRFPVAFGQLLIAVDHLASGAREVVIAGDPANDDTRKLIRATRAAFVPQRVVTLAFDGADADLIPLVDGKTPGPTGALAYVCRNWSCREPVSTAEALVETLKDD